MMKQDAFEYQHAESNAILVDALGSVDALVGSNGVPVPSKYDPFGTRVSAADPTVALTAAPRDLRAGFTGHEHDDDVDLIDMIGRVYDPVQQRFLSVDPPPPSPADSQSYNPYAYVRNNPLNATDPTGYDEVLLGGLFWKTTAADVYGSNASMKPQGSNTLIFYNVAPATNQGGSGQDGPSIIVFAPVKVAGYSWQAQTHLESTNAQHFGGFEGRGLSLADFQLSLDPRVFAAEEDEDPTAELMEDASSIGTLTEPTLHLAERPAEELIHGAQGLLLTEDLQLATKIGWMTYAEQLESVTKGLKITATALKYGSPAAAALAAGFQEYAKTGQLGWSALIGGTAGGVDAFISAISVPLAVGNALLSLAPKSWSIFGVPLNFIAPSKLLNMEMHILYEDARDGKLGVDRTNAGTFPFLPAVPCPGLGF